MNDMAKFYFEIGLGDAGACKVKISVPAKKEETYSEILAKMVYALARCIELSSEDIGRESKQ